VFSVVTVVIHVIIILWQKEIRGREQPLIPGAGWCSSGIVSKMPAENSSVVFRCPALLGKKDSAD
jgi:hypothetical protein